MATSTSISPAQPAILIVHGAYFRPHLLSYLTEAFKTSGFKVASPPLATCGDSKPPSASIPDDVSIVRSEALALKSAGHPIIVLAHSYGGVVATESINKDTYWDGTGGVMHIIYVSAFIPRPGESLDQFFVPEFHNLGKTTGMELTFHEDGTITVENPVECFFLSHPDRKEAEKISEQLVPFNGGLLAGIKLTNAPYVDVKSTYIFLKNDEAVFLNIQEWMVNRCEELADGGKTSFEKVKMSGDHCPFYGKRGDETVEVVKDIWNKWKGQQQGTLA